MIRFLFKKEIGWILLAATCILFLLAWAAISACPPKEDPPVKTPITPPAVIHACIHGYWYIEKFADTSQGYYGIAPLFDEAGHPLRCPMEVTDDSR